MMRGVVILAVFLYTATSSWAQSRSSMDPNVRLGTTLAREFESRVTLEADPDMSQLVDRVGLLLARNSKVKIPLVFKVVDSDSINVFEFTGFVYVTKGVIAAAASEAEFAFAIAHAVALNDSRTWAALYGSVGKRSLFPTTQTDPMVLRSLTPEGSSALASQLNAQREEVLAADKLAIEILYNAGYATYASTSFLQTVEAQSAASNAEIYTIHPKLSARIKKSQEWAKAKSLPRGTEVITTAQYDEVHRRVCQCSK